MEEPCVLIAPQIEAADGKVTTAGLYGWRENQVTATLVDAMVDHSFFPARQEAAHDLAHCDGLVLAPTDAGGVRVLNPATGRVLTLPPSPRAVAPQKLPAGFTGYQTFGLGRDPGSGTYKVVRFFYRSLDKIRMVGYRYTLGAEVFTIGTGDWRETAAPAPYPVIPGRTATFFKGSLFLTVDESVIDKPDEAPGFLRFSLEDESFSITPGPPCNAKIDYAASSLAELRGELWLCVANSDPGFESVEMWTCSALDTGGASNTPQWQRRHVVVQVPAFRGHQVLRPITASAAGTMLLHAAGTHFLLPYHGQTHSLNYHGMVSMDHLKYHHHDNIVEYPKRILHGFDVIPYVPTLVPI